MTTLHTLPSSQNGGRNKLGYNLKVIYDSYLFWVSCACVSVDSLFCDALKAAVDAFILVHDAIDQACSLVASNGLEGHLFTAGARCWHVPSNVGIVGLFRFESF